MKTTLSFIPITDFKTCQGQSLGLTLSYEVFGRPLHSAPVVLITHALTGNSSLAGETGWWKSLVYAQGPIDLNQFTVICFNVPGNGYDGLLFEAPNSLTLCDVAGLFLQGLSRLGIHKLRALIGGSIGGSIGWEMLALAPDLAELFIPIACDYKTTDWLFSQCLIQDYLLSHPEKPLEKARAHAMLCYRTPESLNQRFKGAQSATRPVRASQEWLEFHGNSLNERFSLKAYRLMNHLLATMSVPIDRILIIEAKIHLIGINSDLFFPAKELSTCRDFLEANQKQVAYSEIDSIHGHDAFLIEYDQLSTILIPLLYETK